MSLEMNIEKRKDFMARARAKYALLQGRKEKGALIDAVMQFVGYKSRKHVIHALGPRLKKRMKPGRGRSKKLGVKQVEFIRELWSAMGYPCGKRMQPELSDWVCTWEKQHGCLREPLPHAELSFVPFRVIKNINDAVTEVRRDQCAKAGKEHKRIIKGMRYALLKSQENVSDRQRPRLATLLEVNAPINTAYVLKEQAREMYKLYYFSDAVPALQEWLELARQSGLKPFLRLAKGMARDAGYILNYFRYKLTSGRIEGVNSIIARVLHKTRGVGSVEYLRLKLRALTSPVFRFLMVRETRLA